MQHDNDDPNAYKKSETQSTSDEIDVGYEYTDSGIQEKQGKIPVWLICTAVGLIIWSIYYLIAYWEA